MNKPANRCGCTHTIYSYKREELAEVAKVCLLYLKVAYEFECILVCGIANKDSNKNKYTNYKYKKIGVV